ncbi:hypothetical protein EDB86DRAFT_3081067 [Lactarius hatsudake]|nr:hypothetical protein EDB86DRAFT_3081067 [Lactarius hatsudake]
MTDVTSLSPSPPLVLGHETDLHCNHHSSSFRSSPATRSIVPFPATGFRLLKGPHQFLDPLLHAEPSFAASRSLRCSASPKLSTTPTFHNFESVLRVLILVLLIVVVVVVLPQHIPHLLLHTAVVAAPITAVRTSRFYFDDFGNLTISNIQLLRQIATSSKDPEIAAAAVNCESPVPSPLHRTAAPTSIPTPSVVAATDHAGVILPPTLPQRPSSASPTPRLAPPPRLYTPPIDGSHAAPLRVRPLPVRPPPPGPPSEGDTPIAPFGKLRWTDPLTIPEDDDPSLCDDRRAIDWDLIDEVMKHAS